MRKASPTTLLRLIALALVAALALPNPAFALRTEARSEAKGGLEELEQALQPIISAFSIPKGAPLAAGLEELDAKVRGAILAFQAEPDAQKRLSALESHLRSFKLFQRTQFFGALPWLPDEQKVSNLLSVAFTEDSPLAQGLRRQLLIIAQENWGSPTANTETVLRILLTRMSWENSAEIARKVTISAAMQPAGAKGIDALLPAVVSIGAAESTIRNFREQAQLQSRDLYHRLALSHELIADSYEKMGALTPPGPIRNEIERSRQVEQAYIFLYEAIAQTILAVGPNAQPILNWNARGNGRASYEFIRTKLFSLITSSNPHERLMVLGRLEELERTYADLLIATRRIDLSPSQHNDAAQRAQKEQAALIDEQKKLLKLNPGGLEEIRSVLIAGSDADEIARVWVIVSEELVGVDIRTLELPIETGASFQGADLAIATEPNLAEHELEILGRFPKGLIAPDPQETRLDEEELRQALRDLRDAGLEEPTLVPVNQDFARAQASALAEVDQGDPIWAHGPNWGPDRFPMEQRPSTRTPLKDLWNLSFAAVDAAGTPVAYLYGTHGQSDYPVTQNYPGLFIFRLRVRWDHAGQRLAPWLILKAARAAKERGIGPNVALETPEGNNHARHVYELIGFENKGIRQDSTTGVRFVQYAASLERVLQGTEALVQKKYAAGLYRNFRARIQSWQTHALETGRNYHQNRWQIKQGQVPNPEFYDFLDDSEPETPSSLKEKLGIGVLLLNEIFVEDQFGEGDLPIFLHVLRRYNDLVAEELGDDLDYPLLEWALGIPNGSGKTYVIWLGGLTQSFEAIIRQIQSLAATSASGPLLGMLSAFAMQGLGDSVPPLNDLVNRLSQGNPAERAKVFAGLQTLIQVANAAKVFGTSADQLLPESAGRPRVNISADDMAELVDSLQNLLDYRAEDSSEEELSVDELQVRAQAQMLLAAVAEGRWAPDRLRPTISLIERNLQQALAGELFTSDESDLYRQTANVFIQSAGDALLSYAETDSESVRMEVGLRAIRLLAEYGTAPEPAQGAVRRFYEAVARKMIYPRSVYLRVHQQWSPAVQSNQPGEPVRWLMLPEVNQVRYLGISREVQGLLGDRSAEPVVLENVPARNMGDLLFRLAVEESPEAALRLFELLRSRRGGLTVNGTPHLDWEKPFPDQSRVSITLAAAGLEEGEVVIDRHQAPILAVAISPDGRTIASGDETGRLVIKPVEGGVPLQVQTGPDPIVDLMFDPKGQMIAVGDLKGQIAFYDSKTGQPFGLENGLGRPIKLGRIVWSLAFHQDGHVAVIDDGARIHSVEVKTKDVRRLFGGLDLGLPAGHIARVAVARLEESLHHRFALGSGNTVVVMEDGPNPAVADRFEIGDNQVIQALAMDHSGRYVVVSNIDDTDSGNRIFFRDIGEKTTIELKGPHSQRAQAMAFSPDGAVLASAGKDGNLVFWKVPSGQVIGEINRGTPGERGSPILLHDVVFAPNGQFVLVSVEDRTGETKTNTIQLFPVPTGGLEEGDNSKDRFKSSNIAFDRLMAQAREQGIEAFEIYESPDESKPATLAPKVPGSSLTDPDASLGLEREMRRIFGDEVDRQTYYLRIGAKEGWDGLWAEVVANAGLEEDGDAELLIKDLFGPQRELILPFSGDYSSGSSTASSYPYRLEARWGHGMSYSPAQGSHDADVHFEVRLIKTDGNKIMTEADFSKLQKYWIRAISQQDGTTTTYVQLKRGSPISTDDEEEFYGTPESGYLDISASLSLTLIQPEIKRMDVAFQITENPTDLKSLLNGTQWSHIGPLDQELLDILQGLIASERITRTVVNGKDVPFGALDTQDIIIEIGQTLSRSGMSKDLPAQFDRRGQLLLIQFPVPKSTGTASGLEESGLKNDGESWGVAWDWLEEVGYPRVILFQDYEAMEIERRLSPAGAREAMRDAGYTMQPNSSAWIKTAAGLEERERRWAEPLLLPLARRPKEPVWFPASEGAQLLRGLFSVGTQGGILYYASPSGVAIVRNIPEEWEFRIEDKRIVSRPSSLEHFNYVAPDEGRDIYLFHPDGSIELYEFGARKGRGAESLLEKAKKAYRQGVLTDFVPAAGLEEINVQKLPEQIQDRIRQNLQRLTPIFPAWITEVIAEPAQHEPSGIQIVGPRLYFVLNAVTDPGAAEKELETLAAGVSHEIDQALKERRADPSIDPEPANQFLSQSFFPWVEAVRNRWESLEEGKDEYLPEEELLPEELALPWNLWREKFPQLDILKGDPPFSVRSWGESVELLEWVNEALAMPSGYFISRAGTVIRLNRHRVEEFLGVPYHLMEGQIVYGLKGGSFARGLTAVVLPDNNRESFGNFSDGVASLVRTAADQKISLSTGSKRLINSSNPIAAAFRARFLSPEEADLAIALFVAVLDVLEKDGRYITAADSLQETRTEEKFHVLENIAAARLLGRDPGKIRKKWALVLMRPQGDLVTRIGPYITNQPTRSRTEDAAIGSIGEMQVELHHLSESTNPHLDLGKIAYLLVSRGLKLEAAGTQEKIDVSGHTKAAMEIFAVLIQKMLVLKNGDMQAVEASLQDPGFLRQAILLARDEEFLSWENVAALFQEPQGAARASAILKSMPRELLNDSERMRLVAFQAQIPLEQVQSLAEHYRQQGPLLSGLEETGNEILRILRNELQVDQLTLPTLQQAITGTFNILPDSEKRRINREIALAVLQSLPASSRGESAAWGGSSLLKNARVAGANHSGPFDVTLRWKSGTDGNPPVLESATLDSGGGQVNVAKLFANFGQAFGLTALSGSPGEEIDTQWRNGIASPYVTAQFIPTGTQDKRVNVNHILDGVPLPLMVGWGDPILQTVFDRINADSLEMLSQMTEGHSDRVWFHMTAGGGIRYDASFSPYGSLSRAIKNRFGDRVQLVIDAKFTSTPEELQSVLNVHRPVPQDIFTPNVEELVLALQSTGDPQYADLQAQALSEEQIERFALELLRKHNLLGILVTRDKQGLKLVLADQIIDEKGILVEEQKSPLGAGDATKAAFSLALSQGASWETAVHQANMAGAATVMLDGTRVATSQSLEEVERLAEQQRVAPVIKSTAGLEERQATFRKMLKDEGWKLHFAEPGFVALDTERKAALDIPAEAMAFIVSDDAAISTDGHRIFADDRLTHPDRQYLIWTPSGTGAQEVVQSARQRGAKRGDLLLIPPDAGITIDRVEALLREVGYASDLSDAPRVVIAGQAQVEATALSTLWFLASHAELPRVVFLNVGMKLTDEAGNSYTLIVMA